MKHEASAAGLNEKTAPLDGENGKMTSNSGRLIATHKSSEHSDFYTVLDQNGNFVAKTYSMTEARLIAAAPDLLESANKALTELSQIAWLNPGQPTEARVLTMLRAAIQSTEPR